MSQFENETEVISDREPTLNCEGTPEQQKEEVYRVFKTREEFQQCIDKALGKRLFRSKQQEKELSDIKEASRNACRQNGAKDIFELFEALKSENTNAFSKEQYEQAKKRLCTLGAELKDAVSKELSEVFTDSADLNGQCEKLLADKRFLSLVKNGFSVQHAYNALNFDDVLSRKVEDARAQLLRDIRLKKQRPQEDAVSGYGSFSAAVSPKNLSDAQREEIRQRVRRGEKITF